MSAVFKALQDLKVSWKQIGEYNMKCRWVHKSSISKEKSNMMEAELAIITPTVLKFELQVYIYKGVNLSNKVKCENNLYLLFFGYSCTKQVRESTCWTSRKLMDLNFSSWTCPSLFSES